MRGVYHANIKISGVTTAKTLMYLTTPADKVVEVLSATVTNASNETNEQAEVQMQHITTLGTPTATALTPAKSEQGDQAAASTVKYNVTASEPTYDANGTVFQEGDASLNGWYHQPIPEERVIVSGQKSIGIKTLNTLTSLDLVVRLSFREIG